MPTAKRSTSWVEREIDVDGLVSGNQDLTQFTVNLALDERKDATVTRMLVQMRYRLTGVGTLGVTHQGIVLANSDAIAAATLPDPEIESDEPGWLWRNAYEIEQTDNPAFRLQLDLHGQRKLRGDDEVLVMITEYVGTGTLVVTGWARTLVKHRA